MTRSQLGLRVPAVLFGLALCSPGCHLEGSRSPLEGEVLVQTVGATEAERAHLEQELRREQIHVQRLTADVEKLRVREDALARETKDAKSRIGGAEKSFGDLQAQVAALEAKIQEQRQALAAKAQELDAARTPQDRALLEARIAELKTEAARLEAVLATIPAPAPPPASQPAAGG